MRFEQNEKKNQLTQIHIRRREKNQLKLKRKKGSKIIKQEVNKKTHWEKISSSAARKQTKINH